MAGSTSVAAVRVVQLLVLRVAIQVPQRLAERAARRRAAARRRRLLRDRLRRRTRRRQRRLREGRRCRGVGGVLRRRRFGLRRGLGLGGAGSGDGPCPFGFSVRRSASVSSADFPRMNGWLLVAFGLRSRERASRSASESGHRAGQLPQGLAIDAGLDHHERLRPILLLDHRDGLGVRRPGEQALHPRQRGQPEHQQEQGDVKEDRRRHRLAEADGTFDLVGIVGASIVEVQEHGADAARRLFQRTRSRRQSRGVSALSGRVQPRAPRSGRIAV